MPSDPSLAVESTPASKPSSSWISLEGHRRWLDDQCRSLLTFGLGAGHPAGGIAYLDSTGQPVTDRGADTWLTARALHVYSLGQLLGFPGSGILARTALDALTGVMHDREHGGWYHGIDATGQPQRALGKSCYDHAFVMLAASSATVAGLPGGRELLTQATDIYLSKFWDDAVGRPRDIWDVTFTHSDGYRGLNSTMHSVEAMLAVADAVGDAARAAAWRDRVGRCISFVTDLAAQHNYRLPEHFDSAWVPDLHYNSSMREDQFKPYGATPGHGLEWSRLILQCEATLPDGDAGLVAAAEQLFHRAVSDAWEVDGATGFVYTTDWEGRPVVRQRMHWVVAEAAAAAAALHQRTGKDVYAQWYRTFWDYINVYVIDHVHGSWLHELDVTNAPAATVWPGKPDLYHAVQATLLPRLPLAPGVAQALAQGHLDRPGGLDSFGGSDSCGSSGSPVDSGNGGVSGKLGGAGQ